MKHPLFAAFPLIALVSINLSAQTSTSGPIPAVSSSATNQPGPNPTLAASYGKLPLSFEANQGQSDPKVKFLSRGEGYSLFLTDTAAVLALSKSEPTTKQGAPFKPTTNIGGNQSPSLNPTKTDIIRMELAGATPSLKVTGADQLPGKASYFIGNDPTKWHSNVPTYSRVKYSSVYPGIDLVYYGNQRQLEYDFLVAPNADPKPVKLHFAGADKLKLNAEGDLEIIAKEGQIAFHKPVVYQVKKGQTQDGQRENVEGSFTLLANNTVAFTLGTYDHSRELVIDPVLAYSTYLGGSKVELTPKIAVDNLGNAYVTGITLSSDFPVTPGAYRSRDPHGTPSTGFTGFITKISPAGTRLAYSTYFGWNGTTEPGGIAVDSAGSAYVTGSGAGGAFVAKLNPTGTLGYLTFLANAQGSAIAIDSTGAAYVTGVAFPGFRVTSGAFEKTIGPQSQAAFVTKVNPSGSAIEYSTFLGPEGYNGGAAIAVDSQGHAYVAGGTDSPFFPTTAGAFQEKYPGSLFNNLGTEVGFVTKFAPDGGSVEYSTYLGAGANPPVKEESPGDYIRGIQIDTSGNAYVVGVAATQFFPTTPGAFQPVNPTTVSSNATSLVTNLHPQAFAAIHSTFFAGPDYVSPPAGASVDVGFVTKLNPQGSGLVYSTLFGGSDYGTDAYAIAVDANGDAWITGQTQSLKLPTTPDALQPSAGGGSYSPFITEFKPDGSGLIYSTYFGGHGPNGDAGNAIALDQLGNAYIVGTATSSDFPVTPGAFQRQERGRPAFIAKFAVSGITTTTLTTENNSQQTGKPVTFTAQVTPAEGSGRPTGAVSFLIDGGFIPHVNLDDTGYATYSTDALSPGQHSVVATYLGDQTYSTSYATLTETITGGQVAAPAFWPLSSTANFVRKVTISTATLGATIHYTVDGSEPTTASASYTGPIKVHATSTIKAIAIESGSAPSAVASATYTITPSAATTSTSVNSSLNPSTVGTPVTFTATVTPNSGPTPTGSVTFMHANVVIGTALLINGAATYTTSGLGANQGQGYGIIAVYTGSSTDAESVSPTLAQKVNP